MEKEKQVFILLGGSGKLGRVLNTFLKQKYTECMLISTYNVNGVQNCETNQFCVDFSKHECVEQFSNHVVQILSSEKTLNICVLNVMGRYYKEEFSEFSMTDFEQTMAIHCTNFYGFLSKILTIESISQFNCIYLSSNLILRCNKGTYSYIASKNAGESVIRQLAYEHKKNKNYRFNIIAPGYFGDMSEERTEVKNYDIVYDICKAIVFFLETKVTTGTRLVIDGGETIGY